MEDKNWTRKKTGQLFFLLKNLYMKFQGSNFHDSKETVGIKSVTHSRSHGHEQPKAICPSSFFKVGGHKELTMYTEDMLLMCCFYLNKLVIFLVEAITNLFKQVFNAKSMDCDRTSMIF